MVGVFTGRGDVGVVGEHGEACAAVLQADAADRCIAAGAVSPEKWRDKAATAVNINNSDLDMVEFDGNLELSYSWGNQHGIEFLARGVIRGISEAGFCRGFFES